MLNIPGWVLILVEQFIIVLLFLAVFFFIRARKFKKLYLQSKQQAQQVTTDTSDIIAEQQNESPGLKESGELYEKLTLANQRIKNLERFRDLFFDLKKKVTELTKLQQTVNDEMEAVGLPTEDQLALKEAFEKLKQEKEMLEQHLQQVEEELDVLLDSSPSQEVASTQEDVKAADIVQRQQSEIGRLIQEIADLEVEAATSQRIQANITMLNQQSDEITMAIEVLQDENQFLTEQIQTLLKQEGERDVQLNQQIDLMTTQLVDKQQEYDELYKKYTELEAEYLKTQQ